MLQLIILPAHSRPNRGRVSAPKTSGKRDSNPRPQPWQGCALPTELFPRAGNIENRAAAALRPFPQRIDRIPRGPREQPGERSVAAIRYGATVGIHDLGGPSAVER